MFIFGVADGRIHMKGDVSGWVVIGGDAGPNKTTIHQMSGPPVSQGFPVANRKAGDSLTVIGPSVSAEGKTWWPVSDGNGDKGYLPADALTVTGCPAS